MTEFSTNLMLFYIIFAQLTTWRAAVEGLTPQLKGAAIGACDAMRHVHNGYAPPDPPPDAVSSTTRPNAARQSIANVLGRR